MDVGDDHSEGEATRLSSIADHVVRQATDDERRRRQREFVRYLQIEARLDGDGDVACDQDFVALEEEVATAVQLVEMSSNNGPAQAAQAAETGSSRLRRKVAVYDAWRSLRQTRNVGQAFTIDGVRRLAVTTALLPMHAVVGRLFLSSAHELAAKEGAAAQTKAVQKQLLDLLNIWFCDNGFVQLCRSLELRLYEACDKLQRQHENAAVYGNAKKALQCSLRRTMAPVNGAQLSRGTKANGTGAAELEAGVRQARSEAAREVILRRTSAGR